MSPSLSTSPNRSSGKSPGKLMASGLYSQPILCLSLFSNYGLLFFPKQVVGKQNTLNTARRSYVPETEVRDWNLRLGFRKLRVKIPGSPQPECCTLGKLRYGGGSPDQKLWESPVPHCIPWVPAHSRCSGNSCWTVTHGRLYFDPYNCFFVYRYIRCGSEGRNCFLKRLTRGLNLREAL